MPGEQLVDFLIIDPGRKPFVHNHAVEVEQTEQGLYARVHVGITFHAGAVEHRELPVVEDREAAGVIGVGEHILGLGEQFDEILGPAT